MDLYFLSDVHLFPEPEPHPGRERLLCFLSMLSGLEPANLWIAGDLFDYWFEYRSTVPAGFERILSALRKLSDTEWKLDFIPGNHDWWVGKHFIRETGFTIHREKYVNLTSGDLRITVIHGDGNGPGDTGYRMIKPILRSRISTGIFSILHPTLATLLARGFSGTSRRILSRPCETIPDGLRDWIDQRLRDGCDLVISGHTHLACITDRPNGRHLSLGDWIGGFTYSRVRGNNVELLSFEEPAKRDSELTTPESLGGISRV